MGNLLNTLKGMLSNKNTITILGVLLGVVAIYFVYDNRVKSTATEITVYYVKSDVPANTQLKKENIGTVSINSSLAKTYKGLVTNDGQIMDSKKQYYYTKFDHTLSTGQLLSTEDLVAPDEKLPSKMYNLDPEMKQFEIPVDTDLTQGNSIAPGNSIDLWIKGRDQANNVIFAKFIENLEVLDVVDNNWMTTAGNITGNPKFLITTVDKDTWLLLEKSTMLNDYSFKLVPVVRDKAYDPKTPTLVVSERIRNIIEANTSYIS